MALMQEKRLPPAAAALKNNAGAGATSPALATSAGAHQLHTGGEQGARLAGRRRAPARWQAGDTGKPRKTAPLAARRSKGALGNGRRTCAMPCMVAESLEALRPKPRVCSLLCTAFFEWHARSHFIEYMLGGSELFTFPRVRAYTADGWYTKRVLCVLLQIS